VIELLNFFSDTSTSHEPIIIVILFELLGIFLALLSAVVLSFVPFRESWLVARCTSADQASSISTFKATRSRIVRCVQSRHQRTWLLAPSNDFIRSSFIRPINIHGLARNNTYVKRGVCIYSPSRIKRAPSHHSTLIRLTAVP
jgi:hypothetical protein